MTPPEARRDAVAVGGLEESRIVGSGKRSASGPGPAIMAAQTLEGNDVLNLSGEKLGVLQDIMLDVPRGRIAYAVLERGGVLGIGEKLFAIPWHALTLDTDRKCFLLDIDLDKLRQARGFDKDNWPDSADEAWAALQSRVAAEAGVTLPSVGHVQQIFD
ncbi:PRC-barrel domain-containing protein [Bordetella sp. LUAb4]|uniref:PRC-barrel domain-containing protein n=1 Tax=Bordetella sp. LUAb4 TaxID=2843195 RepID=UPI001E608527|nr:PRC-barrel domain-containing protein [Bordetella sp. LUAb4]